MQTQEPMPRLPSTLVWVVSMAGSQVARKERSVGEENKESKVAPLQVSITALGTTVEVSSNSKDPKMVLLALLRAATVLSQNLDMKEKPKIYQPPAIVVPFGG